MNALKRHLEALPPWILTAMTLLAILWLTLFPDPLGEETPMLFEGADKVVHAVMFGGLAYVMMLDWQRRRSWIKESIVRVVSYALVAAVVGIAIEYIQQAMALGRSFDVKDMLADAVGSVAAILLWNLDLWREKKIK
jgi:VanZ family protein